jgi:hypothetical protein
MSTESDRRMFAPLRRGEGMSVETQLVAIVGRHTAGVTPAGLASELFAAQLAVGTKAPVTKRIAELLDEMEQAALVERIPDGRYRAVRGRR